MPQRQNNEYRSQQGRAARSGQSYGQGRAASSRAGQSGRAAQPTGRRQAGASQRQARAARSQQQARGTRNAQVQRNARANGQAQQTYRRSSYLNESRRATAHAADTLPTYMLFGAVVVVVALLLFFGIRACTASGAKNLTTTAADGGTVTSTKSLARALGTNFADAVQEAATEAANPPHILDAGRTTDTGDGKMTFCAVGDNLINTNLLELADAAAGTTGDGEYDFSGFYSKIKKTIKGFDVAFINQETTLGGHDGYEYNGYPSYNTPDSLADAVAKAGWRVVNTNSNHTYDTWTESIEHAQSVWNAKSEDLMTIGSFSSEADRQTPRLVECNGLRVAFLSYSYGQNGYEQSQLPNDYYAVPYDKDAMQADVLRARVYADAVVVYLHAGDEYSHEASETQKTWAQECADAGADLIIGSHAHVIQPMEWLNASDGNRVLAVYGLGDFLSGYHDYPDCVLSGMFSCTFEKNTDAKEGERLVKVTNVVWTPLIEHWEDNSSTVRLVKDYTEKEAKANELLTKQKKPLEWIKKTTKEVIGDDFEIDM